MTICLLLSALGGTLSAWMFREWWFYTQCKLQRVEQTFLLREIDDQRKMRRNKALVTADAMEVRQKLHEQERKASKEEWDRMWTTVFDRSPCYFNEAVDEKGKFIWERAAAYAFDMRQHHGFTLRQAKAVHGFAIAFKKAMQDEQRVLEAVCPLGEITFDAEGKIKGA